MMTYAQAEAIRCTARSAFRAAAERARDPWLRGYAIRDMRDALVAFDFARRAYVVGGNWHHHEPGELGPMPAGSVVPRGIDPFARATIWRPWTSPEARFARTVAERGRRILARRLGRGSR